MTGADLIKWIKEHKAENMEIRIDFNYAIADICDVKIVKAQDGDYVVLY